MKELLCVLVLFFAFVLSSDAQTKTYTDSLGVEHTEVAPTFKGGEQAWFKFISDNIQYPKLARKQGISGRVWIIFTIDEKGNVTDVTLARGIDGGCDEEAVRVVSLSPPWNPGTQDGVPVKVKFKFPINFTLK